MKPRVTILMPTFNHVRTLLYSIGSIQKQTIAEWELYVVGDGVPDETRDIMSDFCAKDSRISFHDYPKGPRYGETYRHKLLQKAQGEVICYLSDDDLWFSDHLAVVLENLKEANFGHTLHTNVDTEGNYKLQVVDLSIPFQRQRIMENNWGFGLPFGMHTLELYKRLPYGWRTTPEGTHSDVYMWRQFLESEFCIPLSIQIPTAIHMGSDTRKTMTSEEREAELTRLTQKLATPKQEAYERSLIYQQLARDYAQQYTELDNTHHLVKHLSEELNNIKASVSA